MDSKGEAFRHSLLEKQRQKIYDESEKERQKNAKVNPIKHKRSAIIYTINVLLAY